MAVVHARTSKRAAFTGLVSGTVFACFFISGFCSLLYQVLWTRLAFAQFGIITPVLSLTVSTFMLGLGIGSILGGRWAKPISRALKVSPLYLYAAAEAIIGIGAFAVPSIFTAAGHVLLQAGAPDSTGFLLLSAPFIVAAQLPWCIAMGATVPLMMGFMRGYQERRDDSFGLLYATNVIGAASGAAITALALIEIFGIHGTSMLGAAGNITISALALGMALATGAAPADEMSEAAGAMAVPSRLWVKPALFITGFSCVGLEVCWARGFTYELLTSMYAFAAILAVYLLATCAGSALYLRAKEAGRSVTFKATASWLFPAALLPVFFTDPRFVHVAGIALTLPSIIPLSALLGYFTPAVLDRFGGGDPRITGQLYAINIAGGILGPLVAGYVLLPVVGIRWSMILLAAPLALLFAMLARPGPLREARTIAPCVAAVALAAFLCRAYDEGALYGNPNEVHRDYSGSAVAYGQGMDKVLMVNGVPITYLTTVTKVMADLPMALQGHARSDLDICFGMGTTFHTLSLWGDDNTAVDLSAPVIHSFGFFHADAASVLANPNDHAIADDGRRFLMRTKRQFDVITIDPPPPVPASGSSLLYSVQFYGILKQRLAPGGVLAQWLPETDDVTRQSVALALRVSFPYLRVFLEPGGGTHFIASMSPIPVISAQEFLARMPQPARQDLVAWQPGTTPLQAVQNILNEEVPPNTVLPPVGSAVPPLSDDRPFNEYFLLREMGLMPRL